MLKLIKYMKNNINKTILLNQVANLIIGLSMAINIKDAIYATNIYDRLFCIVLVCVQIGLMIMLSISLSTYHKKICDLEYKGGFTDGKYKIIIHIIDNAHKETEDIVNGMRDIKCPTEEERKKESENIKDIIRECCIHEEKQ